MYTERMYDVKTGKETGGVLPTIIANATSSGFEVSPDASVEVERVYKEFTYFRVNGIVGVSRAVFRKVGETLELWELSDPVPMSPSAG